MQKTYIYEKLLHERDASEYLGISISWLQKARCHDYGPCYIKIGGKNGRAVRYKQADLDKWLEQNIHIPKNNGGE